jgi:hypothetical protein
LLDVDPTLPGQSAGGVRLSALCAGDILTPERYSGTHFCYGLIKPQDHDEAERIKYTEKNSMTSGLEPMTFQFAA